MPTSTSPKAKTFVKCDFCSKVFAAKYRLAIHLRTHTGEKPYKCSKCSFACNQRGNLVTHLKTHSGQALKCAVSSCDFSASNDHTMKVHVNKYHKVRNSGTAQAPSSDLDVSAKESSKDSDEEDMPTETSDIYSSESFQPYKGPILQPRIAGLTCVFCFKKFWDRFKLQEHLRVHTGERPFNCSRCSFACNKEINLRSHMRSHKGPVVKCTAKDCYFSASNLKTLRRHSVIAHGEECDLIKTELPSCYSETVDKSSESVSNDEDTDAREFIKVEMDTASYSDEAPILDLEGPSIEPANEGSTFLKVEAQDVAYTPAVLTCPASDCEYETLYDASMKLHSRLHSSIDMDELPLLKDKSTKEGKHVLVDCEDCGFRSSNKKELNLHKKNAHTSPEEVFTFQDCYYVSPQP